MPLKKLFENKDMIEVRHQFENEEWFIPEWKLRVLIIGTFYPEWVTPWIISTAGVGTSCGPW